MGRRLAVPDYKTAGGRAELKLELNNPNNNKIKASKKQQTKNLQQKYN